MKILKSFFKFVALVTLLPVVSRAQQSTKTPQIKDEIIYHIFQRSFFDSNGDLHGDLNGIRLKLNYLQQLGVTAVLLTPLYESVFYHNYFASDFKKIDLRYGTMQDYLNLIKEIHRRGMKLYMDMETQYVTEDHIWWKDSYNNLQSKYSNYILYDDSTHTKPATIVYDLRGLTGYDGVYRKITTVNLNEPKVLEYNYQLFKFWIDPNNDGNFNDGVDGFRLDHMMDDLDSKGRLPHLFSVFWNPLLSRLRKANPEINIVAEQAQWGSFGLDYLTKGCVDRVFAFRLMGAIRSFSKQQIILAADSTFSQTPADKQQVVFIENHDLPRFSYGVKGDAGKLKVGAALNLLLGSIPSIYYGQELGMTGTSANMGPTDANEVPDRQAFEWYKSDEGKGMAYWYKNSAVGRKINYVIPSDGISLEEERDDPHSLWNYYRQLIQLRKANPVLINGAFKNIENDNKQVFSFLRFKGDGKVLVIVNLSAEEQVVTVNLPEKANKIKSLAGTSAAQIDIVGGISLKITPFGVSVLKLQ